MSWFYPSARGLGQIESECRSTQNSNSQWYVE